MLRSWSALRTSLPRAVPTVMARGMAGAPRAVRPHRAWPQWSSPPPQHEYWQPNSWLGAYYKLREGQPVAEANKARLVGKKTPKRGNFIVGAMEAVEMRKLQAAQPWRSMAGWKPGTYLEVDHTPRTGEALERVVGILLGCKRKGLGSSFRLLCNADSTAVEYQFQTFSPLLLDVVVRQESQWRDGKRMITQLRREAHKLNYPKQTRIARAGEGKGTDDPSKYSGRKAGGTR